MSFEVEHNSIAREIVRMFVRFEGFVWWQLRILSTVGVETQGLLEDNDRTGRCLYKSWQDGTFPAGCFTNKLKQVSLCNFQADL